MSRFLLNDLFKSVPLSLVLVLGLMVAPSRGNLVVYTSAAAYNAATTGNTTVDFTGIAPANGFVPVSVPPGVTVGGVNFTIDTANSNGALYVVDGGFASNFFGVTLLDSQFSFAANDNILITLPTAVTAAAFDFGSNLGLNVSFLFSNGDTTTASTIPQTIQFLGVTSSTPFNTIELSQSISGGLVIQDFTQAAAVPEPSSLALFAIGVMGAVGLRRCRRENVAAC